MKRTLVLVTLGVIGGIALYVFSIWLFVRLGTPDQFRFIIVIDRDFRGSLRLVEDPSLPIDFKRTYVLEQSGDTLRVPPGFLNTPVPYTIVEVKTREGDVLSRGDNPGEGEVGVLELLFRQREGQSVFDEYFVIGEFGNEE